MRVKARLTSDQLESDSQPPPDPVDNLEFKSLAKLFPTDPLIAMDEKGWYLSATELDDADDGPSSWDLREASDNLVVGVNGAAMLLRAGAHGIINRVRLTYYYDGRRVERSSARIYSLTAFTTNFDNLDSKSADELLALIDKEPAVKRVVALLAHLDREWIWFDLWRIWDVMKSYYLKNDRHLYIKWVSSLGAGFDDLYYDFENTANNPLFGDDRRHADRKYEPRKNPKTKLPGNKMNHDDAVVFVKRVVVKWIEKEFGVVLDPQFDH